MAGFSCFYPNVRKNSVYEIDFQALYSAGYRGLLFDIDNTLVGHGDPADERAVRLFKTLHETGFKTCLISNNKEGRVKSFADAVESFYVYKANKPSGAGYEKGCRIMGVSKEQALFIGDQLFTDIWGANRAGIRSILVKRLYFHEEPQIHLKRILEWIALAFYRDGSFASLLDAKGTDPEQ